MNPNVMAGLPPVLLQIVAWVLGEYGTLVASTDMDEVCPLPQILERLCVIAERPEEQVDATTRSYFLTALLKLSAQMGSCSTRVARLVDTFSRSRDLAVQQRCLEFQALLRHGSAMASVLPLDASCEDLSEDLDEGSELSRFKLVPRSKSHVEGAPVLANAPLLLSLAAEPIVSPERNMVQSSTRCSRSECRELRSSLRHTRSILSWLWSM